MSMKQTKNMEEKGKAVLIQFLEDYAAMMDLAKKIERVCIIINKMAHSWKKQCDLNHIRIRELQDMFNQEREKMVMGILRTQSATKRELQKEPHVSLNPLIKDGILAKKIKKLKIKDAKRDALIGRYYLKCQRTHSDKFFLWRDKLLKLKLPQRVVVLSAIHAEYTKKNPDWESTTVYSLKEMRIPQNLGLPKDQVETFNKIINIMY